MPFNYHHSALPSSYLNPLVVLTTGSPTAATIPLTLLNTPLSCRQYTAGFSRILEIVVETYEPLCMSDSLLKSNITDIGSFLLSSEDSRCSFVGLGNMI